MGYFYIMTSFSIFIQHCKKFKKNLSKVLKTFENIMESRAFACPFTIIFFRLHSISKASSWSKRLTLCILDISKQLLLANSDNPDELPYKAAFYLGLYCLLRLKQSSGTEIHHFIEI